MRPYSRIQSSWFIGGVAACLALGMGCAWAQGPVKVAPQIFTVLQANEQVGVLDSQLAPGEKTPRL